MPLLLRHLQWALFLFVLAGCARTQPPEMQSHKASSQPEITSKRTEDKNVTASAATADEESSVVQWSLGVNALKPRMELPKELTDYWTPAGANQRYLAVSYVGGGLVPNPKPGWNWPELPGFEFGRCKPGDLQNLPVPSIPFGLTLTDWHLSRDRVTDEGIKGMSRFAELRLLDLGATGVTDAGLSELAGLGKLAALNLSGTEITDKGLEKIRLLTCLQWLNLHSTKITDRGIVFLIHLPRLQVLHLTDTQVSDRAMKDVAKLVGLKCLALGSGVKGPGLAELVTLKHLKILILRSSVDDAFVAALPALEQLEELDLFECGITDTGLRELKKFSGLRSLNLPRTIFSGQGLAELAALKNLRSLNLTNSRANNKFIEQLRRARPDILIHQ